ncbi:MAG: aspartate carbamoyltransferase catalytic subunit [Planctomycetes bacterium]|nr:aspartate carbamoyltransferase catalytic subunit [Planctomycetota bacterium]
MTWNAKDLLGIEELTAGEIGTILDTAESFSEVTLRSVKKVPALRGKIVVNLFYEPSTRTQHSFSLAAKSLSAEVQPFSVASSSTTKGETLLDTARNLQATGADIIILRHPASGSARHLARALTASVINAGDGAHEHPTQALVDLFTLRRRFGRIAGLRVAIVGDVLHSRVARSNLWGLLRLGAQVVLVGPSTLVPREFENLGVEIHHDIDRELERCDAFNFLRIQTERQAAGLFPSLREYTAMFGMNATRARRLKPGAVIMHPGPVNRGVELTAEVADGPRSVILEQAAHGLAVRMAVLFLVSGHAPQGQGSDSAVQGASSPATTHNERS